MQKKVMSKQELLEKREELLKAYHEPARRFQKKPYLCKKERKVLGIGKDQGVASVKHIRIAPRKVAIVANLIKGKGLDEALAILQYTQKAACPVIYKLLKSAEANAVNNNEMNRANLYVADCVVSHGPILKRFIPRGKGSASSIHKRTSHISVVVKEKA